MTTSLPDLRACFPALSPNVAYLDNAAGAMLPRQTIDAITRFYSTLGGANVGGVFALSEEVTALKARAREASATFLNCSPGEVVLGPSATALTWQLSRAFSKLWGPGDEVIVSELEHEANHSPWRALERFGVTVKVWRARWPDGVLDPADLQALLTRETRFVAMTGAANSIGSTTPVREAAALAHSVGAWLLVDGVHVAPHHLPDVEALDVDFFVMSPYKVFGPHLGLMFVRRDLLPGLPADKLSFVDEDNVTKFEAGTAQHELWAGWLGSLAYLSDLGGGAFSRDTLRRAYREIERLEAPLVEHLVTGLQRVDGVELYGRRGVEGRVGTACFNVAGRAPRDAGRALAERGVAVATGHYYAILPMEALGLLPLGAMRASVAHYTTHDDIERLLEGVRAIV